MCELVIVQLNDLHGYLESHNEWFWGPNGFEYRKAGGVAPIKTVLDDLRAKHGNVLVCDNGDTFHGTRPVVATQGKCLIPNLTPDAQPTGGGRPSGIVYQRCCASSGPGRVPLRRAA